MSIGMPGSAPGTTELWQLAYVSTDARPMLPADLNELVRFSAVNNASRAITGMLVWAEGSFFQILEGREVTITDLYARIIRDERHRDPVLLMCEPIAVRTFPRWSMGPVGGTAELFSASNDIEEFFDLLRPSFVIEDLRVQRMLRRFHAGERWGSTPDAPAAATQTETERDR